MPLNSQIVGMSLDPVEMLVTPRMALAYSAVLGETAMSSFDDASPDFAATPLFCVRPEWQFVISARRDRFGLTPAESLRAVHAGQSTTFHALLRPGKRIRVNGTVVSVRQTRAGALSTTKIDISDLADGTLLSSTLSEGIYRDVSVEGGDRASEEYRAGPRREFDASGAAEIVVPLDRWFAHRYSECASIWNPIHTEQKVARAAGLPGSIVHGTALWALAGKAVADAYVGGNTRSLQALSGRFSAMVRAGTPITIRFRRSERHPDEVGFEVLNERGEVAVSSGTAVLLQHSTQ